MERTLTFNMEDALISPMGLAILAGAGLTDAKTQTVYRHITERVQIGSVDGTKKGTATLSKPVSTKGSVWYGKLEDGNLVGDMIRCSADDEPADDGVTGTTLTIPNTVEGASYLVDYYTEETTAGSIQIDIDPSKFAGSFYIEGSTLWRDEDGQDHPVEIVIPNGKVQSNFTFNMSSSGDPSTFNFVVDALADYTAFDDTKKVLAAIQVMEELENK